MDISYNLKFQKKNFSSKILLDKEGEIIIYEKGFRLKGKGAGDKGELISFSEIKEFYYRDDYICFVTFAKEKYTLSNAGTLYDQLLNDLYKSRNAFLMDALFMKSGSLKGNYEGYFQRISKFQKPINRDNASILLYENSVLIKPQRQDAFALNLNFVKFYEFDEIEYSLKIVMEDGNTIFLSQLGNDFEFFVEKFEQTFGELYQKIVNDVLKVKFPHFHAATLLKLAYLMRGGKAVSLKDIEKIDKELANSVTEFMFEDQELRQKLLFLMAEAGSENIYYGIAKDKMVDGGFVKWLMIALPEKNCVMFTLLPRWKNDEQKAFRHNAYFYKIIMQKGNPKDKLEDKILELNKALVLLNFVKDPCYKDKREIRRSPYHYATRKMPFLRLLRKSLVAKVGVEDVQTWQEKADSAIKKAKV